MTTIAPAPPGGRTGRRLAATTMLLAAMILMFGSEALAQGATGGAVPKNPNDQTSWLRSGAIFLVASTVCAYGWYFGVFPRLLRKSEPSWPLDAWRLATYGAWITTCASAYAFDGPLTVKVFAPLLTGAPGTLSSWFVKLILLPVIACIGLLVIWNFRRDAANRARPASV